MAVPDWQLPPGVDRGLWDYLHSSGMVAGYDDQMAASPLAAHDVGHCDRAFPTPGRLVDLGCGTGRLAIHFARKGYDCVGVDLSAAMLAKARANAAAAGASVDWCEANLVDLAGLPDGGFDYAACLFSTLGMVRGGDSRAAAVRSFHRVLRPGGRLVLHVHSRWYRGLGWRRLAGQAWRTLRGSADAGDITMPQAYGGAPLTLHHFTRREAIGVLTGAGFEVAAVDPVRVGGHVYGWLITGLAA